MTLEEFKEIQLIMEANAIQPDVIRSEAVAQLFTETDPVGKVWRVGDEYYIGIPE